LSRQSTSNHQVQKLLKILYFLGRYIKIFQSDTHPKVYKILFKVYQGLEKVTSEKYTDDEKSMVVAEEIKRYRSFKVFLKTQPTFIGSKFMKKQKIAKTKMRNKPKGFDLKPSRLLKNPNEEYFKLISKNLFEIKNMFLNEINRMRKEFMVQKTASNL
jgi:hypothetical protein